MNINVLFFSELLHGYGFYFNPNNVESNYIDLINIFKQQIKYVKQYVFIYLNIKYIHKLKIQYTIITLIR